MEYLKKRGLSSGFQRTVTAEGGGYVDLFALRVRSLNVYKEKNDHWSLKDFAFDIAELFGSSF